MIALMDAIVMLFRHAQMHQKQLSQSLRFRLLCPAKSDTFIIGIFSNGGCSGEKDLFFRIVFLFPLSCVFFIRVREGYPSVFMCGKCSVVAGPDAAGLVDLITQPLTTLLSICIVNAVTALVDDKRSS